MKNLLATLIFPLTVFLTFGINAEDEEVAEPESESAAEAPIEESEDENSESVTEEETEDPEETKPVAEAEAEETEETVPPVPTTPWKRLPVTTKIPVNYDIDLPQDI